MTRIACCLVLVTLAAGCLAPKPQPPPLVIGERILTLNPGNAFTVPTLQPPAKQWYLVDDIGLQQWLGIQIPSETHP